MLGGEKPGIAHVIAVNMGYGHERPAHVLRRYATDDKVIVANDYDGIPDSDRKLWEGGRKLYEKVSRFKRVPVFGKAIFGILDEIQEIKPFYPRRDLSRPNLQLREVYTLIRHKQHMKHLIETLSENPLPIVSTFSPPAFAAEEFGYPGDIYCIATDTDISRAWAPLNPKSSRIKYFAPNGRVVERLKLYGVRAENIELTGFPLPTELIGGPESTIVLKDMMQRLCNLDPNGIFLDHTGRALQAYLGVEYACELKAGKKHAIEVAFAVGGAGAQREIGITIAKSLRREIKQGKIILHLIAGTRPEVAEYFKEELIEMGLRKALKEKKVNILYEQDRPTYFDAFTKLMHQIDILWTKPSELSFYTGLGIPIIMAPPVGSQEDYNRHWLQQIGGGVDQLDPRYTNEWLFDWINSGALARMAWNGYIEAPTHGAYRIADILLGRPNTIHELPLVV